MEHLYNVLQSKHEKRWSEYIKFKNQATITWKKYLHPRVQSSIIYNGQDTEVA